MNIKVAAFTVSKKSINTAYQFVHDIIRQSDNIKVKILFNQLISLRNLPI